MPRLDAQAPEPLANRPSAMNTMMPTPTQAATRCVTSRTRYSRIVRCGNRMPTATSRPIEMADESNMTAVGRAAPSSGGNNDTSRYTAAPTSTLASTNCVNRRSPQMPSSSVPK